MRQTAPRVRNRRGGVSGCLADGIRGSLKTLPNLQTMARRRLADSMPSGNTLLNTPFGNEPLLRHFGFQAALGLQRFQPERPVNHPKAA
ncbi:hypothetical protein [Kingella oralis]|uniref:hypothetical protein n=1 Tax=Kingella oralis TaxID=505 RepID=UPI0034E40F2F